MSAPAAPKVTYKKSMSSSEDNLPIINDMPELSILLENLPDIEINKLLVRKNQSILYGDITPKTQKKWPYERLLPYTEQGLVLRKKANNDLEASIVISIADILSGYVGKPSCFNRYATRGPLTGHGGSVTFTSSRNKKTNNTEYHQHITPMTEEVDIPIHVRMHMLKVHFEKSFFQKVKNKGTAEEKKNSFHQDD